MRTAASIPLSLQVNRLSHSYRGRGESVTALRDVSFRAEAGSVTAAVGPNGSGKSTLFKILAGLIRVQAGEVFFTDGDTRESLGAHATGVVFQSPSLDGQLTVFENLYHHALLYGIRLRRTTVPPELLGPLELDARLDEKVETLSGGFQRRVEIAKALVAAPHCLVMDEPFNGLDARTRDALFATLRRLARHRGIAVLLVTHDRDMASSCDKVLVFEAGALVADAAPADLLAAFGGAVVEIGSASMDRVLQCLHAHMDAVVHRMGDESAVLPGASAADVWNALAPVHRDIARFEARKPSIDDFLFIRQARSGASRESERMPA